MSREASIGVYSLVAWQQVRNTARITVSVDSGLTNQFDEHFDAVFVVQ